MLWLRLSILLCSIPVVFQPRTLDNVFSKPWETQDSLSQVENVVNNYLQYLRWKELEWSERSGISLFRSIERVLDHLITTELFQVLRELPKGGNLHSHENHELSKDILLDIVFQSFDFENLWILPEDNPHRPWTLDFFVNPPLNQGWIRVSNSTYYTKQAILEHTRMADILKSLNETHPADSRFRWAMIDGLWNRASTNLISNIQIKDKYLEALLRQGLSEGVVYYESKRSIGSSHRLYSLDASAGRTFGKRFLPSSEKLDIKIALQISEKLKSEYPQFVGFRRVVSGHRFKDIREVRRDVLRAAYLHRTYPQFIAGYDLVGEEDLGNSLLYHLDIFLDLFQGNSSRGDTSNQQIPLYLHAGETSLSGGLVGSTNPLDPVAAFENIYDAILWRVKRIGHGLAFFHNPYLMSLLKRANGQSSVALEICPVSNQLLGFVPDLRTHPARLYFQAGINIVLGTDVAGTMGYDYFTIDWMLVFLAWNLRLKDLRQLGFNSLKYSSLEEAQKELALQKWRRQWELYIYRTYVDICTADGKSKIGDGPSSFERLFPSKGSHVMTTVVNVVGKGFESGICGSILCRFGNIFSPLASYVNNLRIKCLTPIVFLSPNESLTVDVSISLDGGITFLNTNLNFSFHK